MSFKINYYSWLGTLAELGQQGELLVVQRVLQSRIVELEQSQQENLFYTRCKYLDNICYIILDSGSCCNYCSSRLVNKLSLITIPHPQPYKLDWISQEDGVVVKNQLNVSIAIWKYKGYSYNVHMSHYSWETLAVWS